jgi:hypothetical protein
MVMKIKLLLKAGALVVASGVAATASPKEMILCRHQGSGDVVITIDDRQFANRTLDCISANFISDMTPCAPVGGFGLSAPTGSAALVGIVDRWQDYGDHLGGVTSHSMDSHQIAFNGGFMGSQSGLKLLWAFSISRLTGIGELKQPKQETVLYTCASAKTRF